MTEQERSFALSAGTFEVGVARLFHVAAAPADEPARRVPDSFREGCLLRPNTGNAWRPALFLSKLDIQLTLSLPAAAQNLMRLSVNGNRFEPSKKYVERMERL